MSGDFQPGRDPNRPPAGDDEIVLVRRATGAHEDLLALVQLANELGRDALRLEQTDPAQAADGWRRCAAAWSAVGETGRAAIALDRAADAAAATGDHERATADRHEASRTAPRWTKPVLGGHTGTPQRPLWSFAYQLVPALAADKPRARLTKSINDTILGRPYVFISYARGGEDQAYVERLARELTNAGIPVWYDRHKDPTQQWDREVVARIAGCAAFVVVMSPKSKADPWVQWEVERAWTHLRAIRPVLLAGEAFPSLKNTEAARVPSGRIIPSQAFLDRLRADMAVARDAARGQLATVIGRGIPPKSRFFFGRDDKLQQIEDALADHARLAVRPVGGAAGVGTSQLVAEYAYRKLGEYDLVAWIDAGRPEFIADQVADLAPQLGVGDAGTDARTALAALEALDSSGLHSLIVFDNAEQPDLGQWLDRRGGHVIVTSRRRSTWFPTTIEVDRIGKEHAVQFLVHQSSSRVDEPTAGSIVEVLDRLPLAIEQAAGHLISADLGGSEYLDQLSSANSGLMRRVPTSLLPVATVWDAARDDLRRRNRAAEQLLHVCSFFGPEPIPVDIYTQNPDSLPPPLSEAARDLERFTHAVDELVRRGLVRRSQDHLTVHPLLAEAVRQPLTERERMGRASTVRELLVRHLPRTAERRPNIMPLKRMLMPHVVNAIGDVNTVGEGDRDRMTLLLVRAGEYLRSGGEPNAGGPLLARAVGDYTYARRDPGQTERLSTLAMRNEAKPVLEAALDIDVQEFGPDHPQVALDLRNLAAVLKDKGDYAGARRLLERVLDIDESRYGLRHRQVADDLNELAEVFKALGDTTRARSLMNRAVEIDKSHPPDWTDPQAPEVV